MTASASSHEVTLSNTGERFRCGDQQTLLQAMLRSGRRGIPNGCAGGGCGVCKVHIQEGDFRRTGPVSRAHVTRDEENDNITLACRCTATTDLVVTVLGKMKKSILATRGKHSTR